MFAKGCTPGCSDVFVIKKVKNTVSRTYVMKDFDGEDIFGMY